MQVRVFWQKKENALTIREILHTPLKAFKLGAFRDKYSSGEIYITLKSNLQLRGICGFISYSPLNHFYVKCLFWTMSAF